MKKLKFILLLIVNSLLFSQNNYERTWATYFGGSGFHISEIILDKNNNLIIFSNIFNGGNTAISNDVAYYNQFITPNGAYYQTDIDGYQTLLTKFSPEGNLLFASYLPYSVTEIKQNKQNKWVITGYTSKTNLGTSGTWIPNISSISSYNAYQIVTQLSENFSTEWLTYIPNALFSESYNDFCLDEQNNIYLYSNCSDTHFSNLTTLGAFQPNFITEYDNNNNIIPNGYICKLTNLGQQQWGTYLGLMSPLDIVINNNRLVITGIRNENLSTYNDSYCTEFNCSNDVTEFVFSKFDLTTGQRLFSKYIPSSIFLGGDMTTDGDNFYIINETPISNKITLNAYQPSHNGVRDLYLAKYNSDFQLQWSTYIGGNNFEYQNDYKNWLEYKDNYLYLGGSTSSSSNFIFSENPYSATKQGVTDNFIMKFSTDGALVWGSYYGGLGYERLDFQVTPSSNETFYICGSTTSTTTMTTLGCHQATMNIHPVLAPPYLEKWNCYIAKFTPVNLSSENFSESGIQIYPNPSNGIIHIKGDILKNGKHQVMIYNQLGQQVYSKNNLLANEYFLNLNLKYMTKSKIDCFLTT